MARFEEFQRLFMMSEAEPLSMNAQAALGAVHQPQRSQFSLLVRHFLERFFNHETASTDGDAKSRLVLIAIGTGIPGFMVALYLFPVYHPWKGWPNSHWTGAPPSYWLTVNHHFFFVLYSFVALGIITVFEWDMFFPDLLDVFVLTTLPIRDIKLFQARVAAIAIFIFGFLFDANFLAPLVMPAAWEPPNVARLLAGHVCAVLASGLFSAVFILALQGALLSILGEQSFRRLSLLLQGFSISILLMMLLLFPVLSGAVPIWVKSGSMWVQFCPPFWFLGTYQRILEGPAALPIFGKLAETGIVALAVTCVVAMIAYPIAYLRRVRHLVVGSGKHEKRNCAARPLSGLLHATLLRLPEKRAVFHFISQTILRVPRYRIYLVLYGGVGLSVVVASLLRLTVENGQVLAAISADGVRASAGIVVFWTIAGLRMAFVSPGNRQGSWAFRIVHGRPPILDAAIELLEAARFWALLCSGAVTLLALLVFHLLEPPELQSWSAMASLTLIAAGLCVLLTDAFFVNVKMVAFTGDPTREQPNLAMNLLRYFTFFPLVLAIPVLAGPWIEEAWWHFLVAGAGIVVAHWGLRIAHRQIIAEHCNMPGLEDDEDDFPMKLGLRY